MASFEFSADVKEVARKVIAEHHPALAQLKIAYLKRFGAWSSKGRDTWAKLFKASDRDRLLHEYDYVLVVNAGVWAALDGPTREALIDHELSHVGMDKNGNWKLFGHDLEDFIAVVRRRGAWMEEARRYLEAAEEHKTEQLQFNFENVAAGREPVFFDPDGRPERELRLVREGRA